MRRDALTLPLFAAPGGPPAAAPAAPAGRPAGGIPALVGEEIHAKPAVRYIALGCRSVLNRCDTPRMPDCWTLNPYRGCEFGCTYCYARYTHEYLGFEGWESFERRILVKADAPAVFRAEADPEKLRARPIALGTATDPYQPAEKRHRVTRGILETLAAVPGLRVGIITKSPLVTRDLDLLRRIDAQGDLTVTVSLMTLRADLARKLDTRAPTPAVRLETVRRLAAAGLRTGINAMPILPGINDGAADLEALFAAARDAGAAYVGVGVLFLPRASRPRFLPFLRREFPVLAKRYRAFYEGSLDAPAGYREKLDALIERLRARYDLVERRERPRWEPPAQPQLDLALG